LPIDQIPVINARFARLQSFGELISRQHAEKLAAIARANPGTSFSLWTKRPQIARLVSWSENVILVYSVAMIDPPDSALRVPKGFHKVYAVYSKGSGQTPCGRDPATGKDRPCLSCIRCYVKDNGQDVIRQLLH
jgi:hypothetical protein